MKKRIALTTMLFTTLLHASSTTFSTTRMKSFYEQFLCQQKRDLALAGITSPCTNDNPLPPPFLEGYLPIVLRNNSTLPDNQVYVLVTGKDESTLTQSFLKIIDGVGQLQAANPGDNAINYSYLLSDLPLTTSGRVIYLPKIVGGVVWFSMQNPLNMLVNAPHDIIQPNFTSPADPNYYTNFDIFEVTYVSTGTNIAADATAVSFFSIPLHGYISTPAPGSSSNTGLTESRSTILSSAASLFSTVPNAAEWNKLFLKNGSTTLRLLSPGKGMEAPVPFDENYLDNSASYGYSYINDIWSGVSSYYRTNPLQLTIPNGSLDTYNGVINLDNTITFTGVNYGYVIVLAAPTTVAPTTSFDIFSGKFFTVSDNSPGQADSVQITKLFEEAIIAGLVPTSNTLSNDYLAANQSNYYQINPNLAPLGQTTGPWYDLYSKALHAQGYIYTFAFDEPLWPQVQIFSTTLVENETYIGITIGSIQ